MGRTLTTAMSNALGETTLTTCHLLTVYMDSETVRLTDGHKDITYGAATWVASGEFLEFDGLEELLGMELTQVTVSLSGVDQSWIAVFQQQEYIDRKITIHLVVMDSEDRLITDPLMQFDGRIDRPQILSNPEDGSCTVAVTATNQWVDFERAPGRRTNSQEQQIWFAGDLGFDYIPQLINKQIIWGRSGAVQGVAPEGISWVARDATAALARVLPQRG